MGKLFKISIVLLILGVALTVIFSYVSDFEVFALVDEDDFTLIEEVYDGQDFSKINLDFSNRSFEVKPAPYENDQIRIVYYSSDLDIINVSETNQELKITHNIKWYNQIFSGWKFFVSREYYKVELFLPEGIMYDIIIHTSNGSVNVSDRDHFDNIDVHTSNGAITLDQVTANDIRLDTSNGPVSASGLEQVESLYVSSSNGKITLMNVDADDIDVKTSNGRITGQNVITNDIELDTSNGRIELSVIGDKEDYEVHMDTSNGDMMYDGIEVSQEDFNLDGQNEIDLDTSNGDIVLTFLDE